MTARTTMRPLAQRPMLASAVFFVVFIALGTAWCAWSTRCADPWPDWSLIVPGAIATVFFHWALRVARTAPQGDQTD